MQTQIKQSGIEIKYEPKNKMFGMYEDEYFLGFRTREWFDKVLGNCWHLNFDIVIAHPEQKFTL